MMNIFLLWCNLQQQNLSYLFSKFYDKIYENYNISYLLPQAKVLKLHA